MTNCQSLENPVFLAAQKIKSFEETPEGFFLECFLINTKNNQNDWMVTEDANKQDGHTFKGRPDILFLNDKGEMDHTVGKSFEDSLNVQEPFRKGTMMKIMGTDTGIKLTSISKIEDPETIRKIKSREISFVSPAVFPRSLEDIEIIRTGPHSHIHVLHRYRGLHRAFVDEPAYGTIDATLGQTCEGNAEECMIKLEQVQAGIGDDSIEPLREKKIISVKKCTVTGNTIVEFENTSLNSEKTRTSKLSSEEVKKQVDSAIAKYKADVDKQLESKADVETEKEKEAKKAELEKEKEAKKSKNSKKGNDDDNDKTADEIEKEKEAKKAAEDDKEKDLTARIASEISQKLPLIKLFVAAKTQVAGLDEKAQTELTETLMKASLESVKEKWETIKEFAAAIPTDTKQESPIGYGLGESGYVASSNSKFEDMTSEQLEEAAGVN